MLLPLLLLLPLLCILIKFVAYFLGILVVVIDWWYAVCGGTLLSLISNRHFEQTDGNVVVVLFVLVFGITLYTFLLVDSAPLAFFKFLLLSHLSSLFYFTCFFFLKTHHVNVELLMRSLATFRRSLYQGCTVRLCV